MLVLEIAVVVQLIGDPKANHDGCRHTNSQTKNIDERIHLVFKKVSKGDFDVVFEHGVNFFSTVLFMKRSAKNRRFRFG